MADLLPARPREPHAAAVTVAYRPLEQRELSRVSEIDRTERIETLYVQRGSALETVAGDFSAPPWRREGTEEHSVAYQVAECERYVDAGGTAIGAFEDDRLVGIGVVVPHIRPGVAQLAYMHVSDGHRGVGIGAHLARHAFELGGEVGADTHAAVTVADVHVGELCDAGPDVRHDDADADEPVVLECADRGPTGVDVPLALGNLVGDRVLLGAFPSPRRRAEVSGNRFQGAPTLHVERLDSLRPVDLAHAGELALLERPVRDSHSGSVRLSRSRG